MTSAVARVIKHTIEGSVVMKTGSEWKARARDEKGRFLLQEFSKVEELQLKSDRPMKLVKKKGSYGSYRIKERWLTDNERALIYTVSAIILISMLL